MNLPAAASALSFPVLLLGLALGSAAELKTTVIATTDAKFQSDVVDASADHMVVVVFEAPWCLPCRGVIGGLNNAAQTKGFGVVTLDVDQNTVVPDRLKISSLPVVIAYRGRVAVGSHVGPFVRDTIDGFLAQVGA